MIDRVVHGLDVTIEFGPVPERLSGADRPLPDVEVAPGVVLVHLRRGLRLLVTDGSTIRLHHEGPAALAGDRDWMLLGWGVMLTALQRGWLALHASTAQVGTTAIAIAGLSGAGKSTTALALSLRGHGLLVDDVTPLEVRPDGAWIRPFPKPVEIDPGTLTMLGLSESAGEPLALRSAKRAVQVPAPGLEARCLDAIVCLEPFSAQGVGGAAEHDDLGHQETVRVDSRALAGAEKVEALTHHTACDGLAPAILGPARYFELLTGLAESTEVHLIGVQRPGWTIPEVVERVEALAGSAQPRTIPKHTTPSSDGRDAHINATRHVAGQAPSPTPPPGGRVP